MACAGMLVCCLGMSVEFWWEAELLKKAVQWRCLSCLSTLPNYLINSGHFFVFSGCIVLSFSYHPSHCYLHPVSFAPCQKFNEMDDDKKQ